MKELLVGTYEENKGFHILQLDDEFNIINDYSNNAINYCSYGATSENLLYFVSEIKSSKLGSGGRFIIAKQSKEKYEILSNTNSFGLNPCHIEIKDNLAFISNYTSGTLSIFNILNPNNPKLLKIINFGTNALVHSCIFNNDILHVICKGSNEIYSYDNFRNSDDYKKIIFREETSPRHIVKGQNDIFYIITEDNTKLITFKYNKQTGLQIVNINKLDISSKNCGCAIKLVNDKLYITLRNLNLIKVFDIKNEIPKLIQTISSFGVNPRDIDIKNNNAFVANLESNNLQHFYIEENGILIPSNIKVKVLSPSYVKIKDVN